MKILTTKEARNKIAKLEERFKETHDWVTRETGTRIKEIDGFEKINDLVIKMFKNHFDLETFHGCRGASKPFPTTD